MSKRSDIIARIGADIEPLLKDLKRAEYMVKQHAQKLQEVGQNLSMRVTLPLIGAGAAAVKTAADFERYSKGMEAIMGDANAAAKELEKLKVIAQNPGISYEEAVKGSLRLQAMGMDADKTRQLLLGLGNAIALTGGTATELESVTMQLSQMQAKGKIMTEELKIMAEAAPMFGKAMANAFGTTSGEEISKMVNGVDDFVNKMIVELDKLPKAPDTLANSFNNLQQSIWFALSSIGATLNETFDIQGQVKAFTGWIEGAVESFNSLSDGAKRTIFSIAGIAAAIGPVLFAVGQLKMMWAGVIGSVIQLTKFLNPTTLIIAGIAAAVYIVVRNWDKVKAAIVTVYNSVVDLYNNNLMVKFLVVQIQTAFKGLWIIIQGLVQSVMNLGGVLGGVIKGIVNLDGSAIYDAIAGGLQKSVDIAKETGKKLAENAMAGWKEIFSREKLDYIKEEDVQAGVDNIKGIIEGYLYSATKESVADGITDGVAKAASDLSKKPVDDMTDAEKKKFIKSRQSKAQYARHGTGIGLEVKSTGEGTGLEKMQQMFGEGLGTAMFNDAQEALDDFIKTTRAKMPEIANAIREPFKDVPKIIRDIGEVIENTIAPTVAKIAEVYNGVIGSLTGVLDSFFAYKEGKLEQDKERELKNLELRNMTEEQSAAARQAIEEKYDKKRKEIQRKQAQSQKALSIMQITVDTAVATMKAWSQVGFFGGPIAAAVIASLGAAQIGLVAATPVPALATGGAAFGETLAVVGDNFNARVDPEVISPLSTLKDMITPKVMPSQPVTRLEIEGDKLVFFIEHMNRKMIAQRGYGINFS